MQVCCVEGHLMACMQLAHNPVHLRANPATQAAADALGLCRMQKALMTWMLHNHMDDLAAAERVYEANASWLEYTLFYPPGLMQCPPQPAGITISTTHFPEGTGLVRLFLSFIAAIVQFCALDTGQYLLVWTVLCKWCGVFVIFDRR